MSRRSVFCGAEAPEARTSVTEDLDDGRHAIGPCVGSPCAYDVAVLAGERPEIGAVVRPHRVSVRPQLGRVAQRSVLR